MTQILRILRIRTTAQDSRDFNEKLPRHAQTHVPYDFSLAESR